MNRKQEQEHSPYAHGRTDSQPSEQDPSEPLNDALAKLEACLETPVVPGELPTWAAAIQKACDDLADPLRAEIEDNHPDQFAQMSDKHSDLLRQVELLREEDAQLLQHYGQLRAKIGRFVERAELAEPNESKMDESVSQLVEEGLETVIRIRKQQQAVSTWLMESFQRDTGVGD